MSVHCPSCAEPVCPPFGKSKDLLIVGDAPGRLEMQAGSPFAVHTMYITPGRVLRKELNDLGLSLNQFRITHLWLHEPTNSEQCWQASYNHVLDEAKGKKAILLIGSDTVEAFTGYKVSDVSGLQVDSSVLSAPIIYASVSPALALHRGMGEIKFSISQFVKRLEEEGLV